MALTRTALPKDAKPAVTDRRISSSESPFGRCMFWLTDTSFTADPHGPVVKLASHG
jgi:hypothetical protein